MRHQNLTFHGPADVVDLLVELRGRVRPEMQLDDVATEVDVITVDRDASIYKDTSTCPRGAVPPGARTYRHSGDAVRFRSFTDNVHVALDRLETYRRKHSAVVTTRLHCWLPARSIGIPVDS